MYPALSLYLSQPSSAPVLTPVNVFVLLGQSQISGARNAIASLPASYAVSDANYKVWDVPSATIQTLVPGGANNSQPTYRDVSYTTAVGPEPEFNRLWAISHPGEFAYWFQYAIGGARFTSSVSAATNYTKGVSGGIYTDMLAQWTLFKAALAAIGKVPNIVFMATDIGYSSSIVVGEAATYQADMTQWLSDLRADVITSTTKVIICRQELNIAAGYTYAATIRTAQTAIAAANPTYTKLLNTDGFTCAPDAGHFSATAHVTHGRFMYWTAMGLWFPQSDFTNYCTSNYVPYDLQNTLVSNAYSVMKDLSQFGTATTGLHDVAQATSGSRPAQITINGVVCADFSGSKWMTNSTPFLFTQGSGAIHAALQCATTNFGFAYAENNSADFQPLYIPLSTGPSSDGSMYGQQRNTGGVTPLGSVIGPIGFNGVMNALSVTDTGSSIVGIVNGTAGTPVSYTRGAATLNAGSLGAENSGGSGAGFSPMKLGEMWTTIAVPDAAYLANAKAYMQREYGTP